MGEKFKAFPGAISPEEAAGIDPEDLSDKEIDSILAGFEEEIEDIRANHPEAVPQAMENVLGILVKKFGQIRGLVVAEEILKKNFPDHWGEFRKKHLQ